MPKLAAKHCLLFHVEIFPKVINIIDTLTIQDFIIYEKLDTTNTISSNHCGMAFLIDAIKLIEKLKFSHSWKLISTMLYNKLPKLD